MQKTFVKTSQHYFKFLVNEFGFILKIVMESPRGEPWEGMLQYGTDTTLVDINCTRGEIPSLAIGRAKDGNNYMLPIQVIYEYMSLSPDEKRTILSISEASQAVTILSRKQLVRDIPQSTSAEEKQELILDAYAKYLREHIFFLLQGDFSRWKEFWEYHVSKLTTENARAGRSEFVPVVVTDDNGQFKVIGKQHVFQKGLDYINQLKDEQDISK
ncbi:MAG TPA: hypothetical protein VFG81_18740 [Anaerolineales bacterium]|jgi:hypothetical protein|nr:hypothetical protein [Anaerolineales bacterium]